MFACGVKAEGVDLRVGGSAREAEAALGSCNACSITGALECRFARMAT
jgi:hypothetical protein